MSCLEELLSVLFYFLFEVLSSRDYALELCSAVELVDDEEVRLADERLRIFDSVNICLRERAESLIICAEVNFIATLNGLGELAENRCLFFCCLLECLALFLCFSPLLGNNHLTTTVVEL